MRGGSRALPGSGWFLHHGLVPFGLVCSIRLALLISHRVDRVLLWKGVDIQEDTHSSIFFCTPPSLGFSTVQGFNPNPREKAGLFCGRGQSTHRNHSAWSFPGDPQRYCKALSPQRALCVSHLHSPSPLSWWVGFSLFFSSLAHRPFPTLVSLPLLSVIPLQATDSFYVVLFLSKSHMPIF